jgi:hypothetical protein
VSWDLYVLPLATGEDPNEAIDRLEDAESGPPDAAIEQRKQELAEALQQTWPELEPFPIDHEALAQSMGMTVEEAREQFRYIELNPRRDEDLPIQVTIADSYVSVNVPYWDLRDHGDSVTARLTSLVDTVVDRTGWSVYDPQAGRVITVAELPGLFVQEQSEGAAQMQTLVPPEQHRKRLFGLF